MQCLNCPTELTGCQKKFCSCACSASYTQRGKASHNRKHAAVDAPPPTCLDCGAHTGGYDKPRCPTCARELKDLNRLLRVPRVPTEDDRRRHTVWCRKNYNKFRDKLVQELGGLCVRCQKTDAESHLDFDHVDPLTKTNQVTWYINRHDYRGARREAEKCQLLCRPCHNLKSKETGNVRNRGRTGPSPLTEADVLFIRKSLSENSLTVAQLALKFGVKKSTITNIKSGRTWIYV